MIEGNIIEGAKGYKEVAFIRSIVFTEEQGVDPAIERDPYDDFAHHLVISEDHEPVGVGRLIYKDNQYLIGRIAVLPSYRGKGYGDLIVRMLCARAFDLKAKEVVVHAQEQVEGFYKKIGFERVGEPYEEAQIPHVTMMINKANFLNPCNGSCQCK